jgi:DNA-binding MarR family transcriptional regulator
MSGALDLDDQLCVALYNASRAMTRAYTSLLEPLGVTYPQYLVLLALWEKDGVPVKRVGARLGLDSATLTPLLKRLEARGIVERRRDDADERLVRIFLTTAGAALHAKARKIPEQLAARAGFSGDDGHSLRKLRGKLVALTGHLERAV